MGGKVDAGGDSHRRWQSGRQLGASGQILDSLFGSLFRSLRPWPARGTGTFRNRVQLCGAWRSLVAHTLGVRVVAGSNPAAPTQKPAGAPSARVARMAETLGQPGCRSSACLVPAQPSLASLWIPEAGPASCFLRRYRTALSTGAPCRNVSQSWIVRNDHSRL